MSLKHPCKYYHDEERCRGCLLGYLFFDMPFKKHPINEVNLYEKDIENLYERYKYYGKYLKIQVSPPLKKMDIITENGRIMIKFNHFCPNCGYVAVSMHKRRNFYKIINSFTDNKRKELLPNKSYAS